MKKLFYIFLIFNGCNYTTDYVQIEFNLDREFEYVLTYGRDYIHPKAEIVMEGYIIGKGVVNYFHPPYSGENMFYNGFIIQGDINIVEESTWYGNDVLIKYIPLEDSNGKLLVKFKVF